MRTVVWDVDDVLCPTLAAWLEQRWRPDHPDAPAYEGLLQNPPAAALGVDLATYHASLDAFRRDQYGALRPAPALQEFFADRGHRYRHVALTATPRFAAPIVAGWVLEHLGDWIRTFAFVPSPRPDRPLPSYDAGKEGWLRAFGGADLFLDDNPEAVAAARAAGIESWLVAQPWNDGTSLPELLARL